MAAFSDTLRRDLEHLQDEVTNKVVKEAIGRLSEGLARANGMVDDLGGRLNVEATERRAVRAQRGGAGGASSSQFLLLAVILIFVCDKIQGLPPGAGVPPPVLNLESCPPYNFVGMFVGGIGQVNVILVVLDCTAFCLPPSSPT